ncbi:MAG: Rrf2 family transcriptional regulator [Chloroflexi bacterium]|nr:Rrf2 family transcriptional regulator [Chloroflexota bacterium]
MEFTREADYAIRTMLEVACQPSGVPTTTLEIARRRLVPRPFLRKIVPRLVAARLLRTRRGAGGGLLLARPAGEIDLLTIVEVAQGPIAVNRCVLRPDICPLQPTCPVHEVCRLAHAQFTRLFGGVTLADMVRRGAELRAGPRPLPERTLPTEAGAP